jgi:dihydroorotase
MQILIKNALIINEGRSYPGSVRIEGAFISKIYEGEIPEDLPAGMQVIDATGKWLLPGAIDDQVHFREPGLTHKGDLRSESRAAVAGGITTYMDMPNTIPQTTSPEALEWKFRRAAEVSVANYTFFFGGTNENAALLRKLDRKRIPGVKLFLGSSTGEMLVDRRETLRRFFGETDLLIAVHAEKEDIIRRNSAFYAWKYGKELDTTFHPKIRSAEACYASSSEAVALARRLGTKLHLFHLSTAQELSLLDSGKLSDRKVTGEVCVHHLWFCEEDYARLGNQIKWNPAIKTAADREALRQAVADGTIAVVATDHAPHLPAEKAGSCLTAASGGPMVQHAVQAMLELAQEGVFSKERVVDMMAHRPAVLYRIDRRGFIREGFFADLVLVDPQREETVQRDSLFYKSGWSPFEGIRFRHTIDRTFVNGRMVYAAGKMIDESPGMELKFA